MRMRSIGTRWRRRSERLSRRCEGKGAVRKRSCELSQAGERLWCTEEEEEDAGGEEEEQKPHLSCVPSRMEGGTALSPAGQGLKPCG